MQNPIKAFCIYQTNSLIIYSRNKKWRWIWSRDLQCSGLPKVVVKAYYTVAHMSGSKKLSQYPARTEEIFELSRIRDKAYPPSCQGCHSSWGFCVHNGWWKFEIILTDFKKWTTFWSRLKFWTEIFLRRSSFY